MPLSRKQLTANRRNAQKSTGPRTPEGRHVSARNSTRHGLYSGDTVINCAQLKESSAEYQELQDNLLADLKPEGALQRQLVLIIANCLWRQRRAILAETAHLNRELKSGAEWQRRFNNPVNNPVNNPARDSATDPETTDTSEAEEQFERDLATLAAANSIPQGAFSLALMRYEMRNDLRLTRAYELLMTLQRRSAESQPRPSQNGHSELTPNMRNEPISPQPVEPQIHTRNSGGE